MAYTTIDKPTDYFNTKLYTGTGSSNSITGVGFQPDWIWWKHRGSATYWHNLMDSVRGASKQLYSNASDSEGTNTNGLESFDSDGFTVGSDNGANESGQNFVSWNWLAGGTAPAITYSVKVVSDSGNKYRFDDFGTSAVTLDLQEGGTYTFDQSDSSNSGHPLRFSTTSNGTHGGGSEYTTGVTTTGTPGSAGAKTVITVAASAPTLYYYCTQHSGMGGQANTNSTFGSSNFSGSIQSTVSANTTAGFSIVSYTGTGSNATIGHGLGKKPDWIIVKAYEDAQQWAVQHSALGATKGIRINTTAAAYTSSTRWNNTEPTSSVFSVGSEAEVNTNTEDHIAYCFTSIKGYSKFGSYTGNGNSDGAFVYTGFKPAFIIQKSTSINANWPIWDSTRNTSNIAHRVLNTDLSDAEYTSADGVVGIDILSNGFKMRDNNATRNQSGVNYIYIAFAESPFVNSNGVPTNAR